MGPGAVVIALKLGTRAVRSNRAPDCDLDWGALAALMLYGIWLEGLVTNAIPESPPWFLTAITTSWHGVMTTCAASEVTEAWLPRRSH